MVRRHKRVFVHRNEACAEGKVLVINSDDISISILKVLAGEKLGIKATRVFLSTGAEVRSEDELQNDDNLYFSAGEAFYRQCSTSNEKMDIAIIGAGGVGKSAVTMRFLRDTFVQRWEPTIQDIYSKTVRIDNELSVLELLDTAGQEDFVSMRSQWMMDKDAYVFVYSLLDKASVRQLYSFVDLLQQVCDGYDKAPPVIFIGNKRDLVEKDPGARVSTFEEISYVMEAYEEASRNLDRRGSSRIDSSVSALNSAYRQSSLNSSMQSVNSLSAVLFEASNNSIIDNAASPSQGFLRPWMNEIHFECSALTGENIEVAFHELIRAIRRRRKDSQLQSDKVAAANEALKKKSFFRYCNIL